MGTLRAPWPFVWVLLQLGWLPAWLLDSPDRPWRPLTFSPARLMVPEGANATFTCSFSNTSEHFVLNWYRMSPSNQTDKLAAFPEDSSQPGRGGRFRVTRLPNGRDFHMSVLAARRNDSGIYLCGAISLPPKTQINESPRAELTVTERIPEPPTEHPSPPPSPAGQLQGLVVGITSLLVGVLLVLLLACVLTTTFPRAARGACGRSGDEPLVSLIPFAATARKHREPWGRAGATLPRGEQPHTTPAVSPCLNLGTRAPRRVVWALPLLCVCTRVCARPSISHSEAADSPPSLPKKEGPSAPPTFSVDYGELDFQWREKTPEPPAPCVPEQTEYATIVFPGRPGSQGRRASADDPQGPRPLRPEDGHCSWPL
uniref:Programmed cell death protein 1 n=1 Tax=Equus asinus TaxID=9793 RepID=A0A9L0JAF7_EQUAS